MLLIISIIPQKFIKMNRALPKSFWRGRGGNSFSPHPFFFPPRPSGMRSGIFQEIGSSFVVNILHNQTFCKFAVHFGGGTQCHPSRLPRQTLSARRAQARLAVGQDEGRPPYDFNSFSFHLLCPITN